MSAMINGASRRLEDLVREMSVPSMSSCARTVFARQIRTKFRDCYSMWENNLDYLLPPTQTWESFSPSFTRDGQKGGSVFISFVPTHAYQICLSLPAAFTQPGSSPFSHALYIRSIGFSQWECFFLYQEHVNMRQYAVQ